MNYGKNTNSACALAMGVVAALVIAGMAGTGAAIETVVFQDSFESGNLGSWSYRVNGGAQAVSEFNYYIDNSTTMSNKDGLYAIKFVTENAYGGGQCTAGAYQEIYKTIDFTNIDLLTFNIMTYDYNAPTVVYYYYANIDGSDIWVLEDTKNHSNTWVPQTVSINVSSMKGNHELRIGKRCWAGNYGGYNIAHWVDNIKGLNVTTLAPTTVPPTPTPTPTPSPTITQTLIPTTTPTPTTGSISVSSSPSGASIYLDGVYQGKTTKLVTDVSTGYHNIEVKLEGYNTWSDRINVMAGSNSITAQLSVQPTATSASATPASISTQIPPSGQKQTADSKINVNISNQNTQSGGSASDNSIYLGIGIVVLALVGIIAYSFSRGHTNIAIGKVGDSADSITKDHSTKTIVDNKGVMQRSNIGGKDSIDDKLVALKDKYDKGLISEDVYKEKQRELLDKL